MTLRLLLSLLTIAVMITFGQSSVPIKAGDAAPNLVWTKVLRSASPSAGKPGSFLGQVTVLVFFPNVSANESLVSEWNQLCAQFAEEPVRFVWITSEDEGTLAPWLQQHPVSGWLLHDPQEKTAHTYGVEMSGGALIDTQGKIAGFTFLLPDEQQIRAVQEGRVLALHGDADDAQMNLIMAGKAVRLDAEPHRLPAFTPPPKPDISPSYEVHISPSHTNGTDSSEGPDQFVYRGYDLRGIMSVIYKKDPSRLVLPAALEDEKRYDFVLVLPHEMNREEMYQLVQGAIEKYFHLSVQVESRPMQVYVMTAVDGEMPGRKTAKGFGSLFISSSTQWEAVPGDAPPTIETLKMYSAGKLPKGGISQFSAFGATMDDLRQTLEQELNRPIVDETNLDGAYEITVQGKAPHNDDLLQMLREQAGIVLTPAQRKTEMLVVTPVS